jgi:hypothetical protein
MGTLKSQETNRVYNFNFSIAKRRQKQKKHVSLWLLLLMLISALIGQLISYQIPSVGCKSNLFSFVQVGDTQGANQTQLQSIINFVLGNMTTLKIQYVAHMGDIVEVSNNETDWELKNAAFSQLTGIVPFGWLTGNHDGEPKSYIGDEYSAFNVSNYPAMISSYDQGRNTAQYFNFSGTEILFVNLDYFANETALEWFENLYQQYPKATVIFSTHSYLDLTGNYTGDTINSTYLDAYPRVKLALCGHLPYVLNQQVNGRNEIRFDYQLIPGYSSDLSDFIRVYTVFDDGTVDAWTYSQLRNQFLTDSANQFSFSLFTPPTSSTIIPSPTPPTATLTPNPTPTPISTPTSTDNQSPSPTLYPTITPTPKIPEFPSGTVLVIFLGGAILSIVFYRKEKKSIPMNTRTW